MMNKETVAFLETNYPSIEIADQQEFGVDEIKAFATTLIPIATLTLTTR